jgi:hypothetical protein
MVKVLQDNSNVYNNPLSITKNFYAYLCFSPF